MRAVWSFWTKPFQAYMNHTWTTPLHHYLAWGLSVRLASRHYPETMLVTDTEGAALLVDRLGLSFTHVSTELDSMAHHDAGWWTLGKLKTYSLQQSPFIHLDTDVFLWKALPSSVTNAPVFAQCTEEQHPVNEWCGAADIEAAFALHNLPLPTEWQWLRAHAPTAALQYNCGILGANDTAFIRHYSSTVLSLLLNPAHAILWSTFPDKSGFNPVIEQFTLATILRYHQHHPSVFPNLNVRFAFSSFYEAYDANHAARLGFTHLLGPSKRNPIVMQRLEQRTRREAPHFYDRCLTLTRSSTPTIHPFAARA